MCAVFGLGAVGLAAIMGCKAASAKRIIAVDINPAKFEKARMLGATDCINPGDHKEPIQDVVVEMTGGGVDFALECVGSPVVMVRLLQASAETHRAQNDGHISARCSRRLRWSRPETRGECVS